MIVNNNVKILLSILCFIFAGANLIFAQGYVCAIGGGSEDYGDWSDAPYSWVVQKSDSGKIVVPSVNDETNWIPDYFMSFGADTAYNLRISSRAIADLQSTYDEIISAKAVFIKGGDQWKYVNLWKGTKTEDAIYEVFNNGGVIAGTSAGCAVLGAVDFSAKNGSAYSDDALVNPFTNDIQLEDNFLNLVPGVLFDSHFVERARHGRLMAMLYDYHYSKGKDVIGAGIDDRTAICITPDGIGEVMGSGAVYIFQKNELTNYKEYVSGDYAVENLKCDQLTKGWKYDFTNREINYMPPSAKEVDVNRNTGLPLTNFWLTGSNTISSQVNVNLPAFLNSVNSNNVLIIIYPGYISKITSLTDFLSNNSYNYSVLSLQTSMLNDTVVVDKILNSTCILLAGDSLNVLNLLRDGTSSLSLSFYNRINSDHIPIFSFGDAGKILGDHFVDNMINDIYAGYRGKMANNDGLGIFGDLIFQPSLFEDPDYHENRMSSVLWGLMRNRERIGIYLNGTSCVRFNHVNNTLTGKGNIPPIIIDASETSFVDSSVYRASNSVGPRQIVAMNNLRFSFATYDNVPYLIEERKFDFTSAVDEEKSSAPQDFLLMRNFPNPFNPMTNIGFRIANFGLVRLKIYDILGNEITTLVNEEKPAGTYEVKFDASDLASGMYFARLSYGSKSLTIKMLLLK